MHDICAEFDVPAHKREPYYGSAQLLVSYRLLTELEPLVYLRTQDLVTGSLSLNPRGFGFVEPELSDAPNLFIDPLDLYDARHRDRVKVEIYTAEDGRVRGRIKEVLERGVETCVGIIRWQADAYWLSPQNDRLPPSIRIVTSDGPSYQMLEQIEEGSMVAALLFDHPASGELSARPLHVINPEDPQGELESVIYGQGLQLGLSREAQDHALQFPDQPTETELSRRRDLRHLPFITIDPESAKDFDDALYAQPKRQGEGAGWVLWIAIADVAHYVSLGSPIDEEAMKRSATLYLPAQAFPMLPHRLSNDLCSLKPRVDRLAMVVRVEVSPQGDLSEGDVYEAVIHSQARLAYDEAAVLLGVLPSQELPKHIVRHRAHVKAIRDCARALKNRRRRRGFLNLELIEPRLNFNISGMIEGFKVSARHEAHEMVEEAMLAANESVASLCIKESIPALYRLHATPPDRGIERFEVQSELLGAPFISKRKVKAHHLSKYLKHYEDHPRSELLSSLLLRSMSRAEYDPTSGLHFGLGTETYLHFTSPIRRYPDLWVHRQIKAWLTTKQDDSIDVISPSHDEAVEVAAYASRRERLVMEAERRVIDAYKALYMRSYVGEVMQGTVCQTSPKGFLVDLDDYPIWCTHSAERLPGSFRYEETKFMWRDVIRRRKITLGSPVEVRIVSSDVSLGRVEVLLSDL